MRQFVSTYMDLRRNMKLSERRSPLFEQNKAGLVFMYIGYALMALYLIVVGTTFGRMAGGGRASAVFSLMPYVMLLDFLLRINIQQTPAVLVKPYLLMPMSKRTVIDCFLVYMLFGETAWLWLFLFVPLFFVCLCGGLGFLTTVAMLATCLFLIVINGQWYLLVRTLATKHIAFWLLPVVAYCLAFAPCFIDFLKGLETVWDFCDDYGFTVMAIVIYVALFIVLFIANRKAQLHFVSMEVAKKDTTKVRRLSHLGALDRFGAIGEYLKLEVKSALRNKAVKQRYLSGFFVVGMLSVMTAYTDVYDGAFSRNIWCLYSFVFFGAVNLVKVMGVEGNYIDLLMVQKEHILTLLKAKYYFYCAVLLIPLLILLPTVISGKYSVLMVLAYLFTTSGTEYFLLFQLAVYNKQTLALNQSLNGKGSMENTLQMVVTMVVFFFPAFLALTLSPIFGPTVAYTIMIVIGIGFTLTHDLWLRNIYTRMMRRRYDNLDSFHATRP